MNSQNSGPGQQQKRILIIDDDPDIRKPIETEDLVQAINKLLESK